MLSALSSDQTITPAVCTPKTRRAELRAVFAHLLVYGLSLHSLPGDFPNSCDQLPLSSWYGSFSNCQEKLFLTVDAVVTSVLSKWHILP